MSLVIHTMHKDIHSMPSIDTHMHTMSYIYTYIYTYTYVCLPMFPLSCARTFRLARPAYLCWRMLGIGLECYCSQHKVGQCAHSEIKLEGTLVLAHNVIHSGIQACLLYMHAYGQ